MTDSIEARIARCEACVNGPAVADWLPVSYFGDYRNSNAWILSINPSDQEFLDRQSTVLTGPRRRFRRLSDFEGVPERRDLGLDHIESALKHQNTYFVRPKAPYRPFFNRLGRFLGQIQGVESAEEPLTPFIDGVGADGGTIFRYAHLDIVKCATKKPWSRLLGSERALLLSNCSEYLEEQMRAHAKLRLILINGRTAYEQCHAFLVEKFGFAPTSTFHDLGHTLCEVWSGSVTLNGHEANVVGWSANVVNQQLTKSAVEELARSVRNVLPCFQLESAGGCHEGSYA